MIFLVFLVVGLTSTDDVLSRIDGLECQFRLLHGMIVKELEDKRIPVTVLLGSLRLLPTGIRNEYKPAITEIFPDLRRENSVRELFYHLSPLVDFLGYDLLKYFIKEFGSNTLKVKMESYSDEVLKFMKETTVKQLMDVWPGHQEIPPSFSKLRAKIDQDPRIYTLHELDRLRRRFCAGVKLTDIVLVLIGLETANSFIAEWLVPSTLMPHLMESSRGLEFGFYLRERILKMTLDEKQIFPFLPDSKPKVPALQAAATTADKVSYWSTHTAYMYICVWGWDTLLPRLSLDLLFLILQRHELEITLLRLDKQV